MKKKLTVIILLMCFLLFTWRLFSISDIQPVSWLAPISNGFKGQFSAENNLLPLGLIEMSGYSGPEDITLNASGELFISSAQGHILRFDPVTKTFVEWAYTGGYPLGIRFDNASNLIVADAALGLLSINPQRQVTILANRFEGKRFGFVDAVAIDDKGVIYFSDASEKFSPRDHGGPEPASEKDIFEHGGNGKIYAYHPQTNNIELLVDDLYFANGVSLTHDQQALLIVETAKYRLLKYYLHGERKGEIVNVMENLPGFPDNIVQHPEYGYWIGLTAPRSKALDKLSTWPTLRQLIFHLPHFLRPAAQHYGHVVHIDETGQVITSLQDPSGSYSMTTGALQHDGKLYITSLTAKAIAVRRLND